MTEPEKKEYSYTVEEIPKAIACWVRYQNTKDRLENKTKETILKYKTKLSEHLKPIEEELAKITNGLKKVVEQNRQDLFKPGTKTVKFETGIISYREAKESVETELTEKFIETALRKNNLWGEYQKLKEDFKKIYLTIEISLDKSAILKDTTNAKSKIGVKINPPTENFHIKAN